MVAATKELLKGRTKAFKDHSVVFALRSKPANRWDASVTCEALIHFVFVFKLRVIYIDGLELDCNLFF